MNVESAQKVPWNLSINAEVKRQMAIYCATIGRDVSEVTEELYAELLHRERQQIDIPPTGNRPLDPHDGQTRKNQPTRIRNKAGQSTGGSQ